MANKPKVVQEESLYDRASYYCRQGELAAHYIIGVADALEALGGEQHKGLVHRLRCHGHDLNSGTLYVEHGYKEPKA